MSDNNSLLKSSKFLPLFITQFFGSLNDTVFRTSLVLLITYKITFLSEDIRNIMVSIAVGVFILPFFLFSSTAGQIGDKYSKSKIIRYSKLAELLIMLLAIIGFWYFNLYFLLLVLFLMGAQTAFFTPVKYSIIPEELDSTSFIKANGYLEGGTFLSILIGTILAGVLVQFNFSGVYIASILSVFALIGFVVSFFINSTKASNPSLVLQLNIFKSIKDTISNVVKSKDIFLAILAISWFWLVGSIVLSQLPLLVKNVIGANESVLTFLFLVFSIGLAFGSLLCNQLLKSEISPKYVPLSILLLTIFLWDAANSSTQFLLNYELISLSSFLSSINGIRLIIDFALVSILGGVYIIPLYSIIQTLSHPKRKAQIFAANSIFNSFFMVLGSVITTILLSSNFSVTDLLIMLAIANLIVSVYICKILPAPIVKAIIKSLLSLFFRVKVKGIENFYLAKDKTLIVANNTSLLDGLLLAVYLPDNISFTINSNRSNDTFLKLLKSIAKVFEIDPLNPLATKSLIEHVRRGRKLVIFPEGRVTNTGSLMKIYEGSALIMDKSDADILPVKIDGAAYSLFSRLHSKYRIKWFPKITLTILPPRKVEVAAELYGRKRRRFAADELYDIMTDMMIEATTINDNLFISLLQAKKINGGKYKIVEDINRKPVSYSSFILRSLVLGRMVTKKTKRKEHVGIMLPNTNTTALLFFAMHSVSRVPAMINFSAGPANIVNAVKTAKIKSIYTSRKFIEATSLHPIIEALTANKTKIVYLEDIPTTITIFDKLVAIAGNLGLNVGYSYKNLKPNDKAVILFTSGSEGTPKAVVLSHKNVQSNCQQILTIIDLNNTDKVFNALPMFHSFGLTAGTILPIISGVAAFFYPSPLHYRIVPEMVYDTNSTIMFGTDTFFSGYAKFAHSYDFQSVRYAIAGAEKLKDDTRNIWINKFGVRIFEGYGVTETSPVLSVNTPMFNKVGSVGKLLPGIFHKLEPVEGIEKGGRLFVKGDNVMVGYMLIDKPGVIKPLEDGMHDTGDIVDIDEDGYVTIVGRAKRFAKIGGEMVSLAAVETYISAIYKEQHHAVVSINDDKKGEQIVLVTDCKQVTKEEISTYAAKNGITALNVPKQIIIVEEVPLLGSGKTDYAAVKNIALNNN